MFVKSRLRAAVAALTVAPLILIGNAGGASASHPSSGTYTGNKCDTARWQHDNGYAYSGTYRHAVLADTWVELAACAFDMHGDGKSAENYTEIWQYSSSAGWVNTKNLQTIISSGKGYSKVGGLSRTNRMSGATHLFLRVWACQIDASTGRRGLCSSKEWTYLWNS